MTDISPQARSRLMAKIKGKNTKPEVLVRKALYKQGYRYRLHERVRSVRPDLVLKGRNVAIFIHGCFWHQHHGCRHHGVPQSNSEFWRVKFGRNAKRDRRDILALGGAGWRVAVIWECAITPSKLDELVRDLARWLEAKDRYFVCSAMEGCREVSRVDDLELPPNPEGVATAENAASWAT
ncbi:very short patch repair endonuclease [Nostoc sp. CHAB 5844]|nr:very short patch repair endonuclease [Nostoc sp. CHAB 5844]